MEHRNTEIGSTSCSDSLPSLHSSLPSLVNSKFRKEVCLERRGKIPPMWIAGITVPQRTYRMAEFFPEFSLGILFNKSNRWPHRTGSSWLRLYSLPYWSNFHVKRLQLTALPEENLQFLVHGILTVMGKSWRNTLQQEFY